MPEYKLAGARRDNGQAVKFRTEQPDEASVIRLAQKRGILITSITEITPTPAMPDPLIPPVATYDIEGDLDQLANSAFNAPPVAPADPMTIQDDADDDQDTVDNEPATQTKAPMYIGVKYCASIFSIMGSSILLIAMLFLIATLAMLYKNGLKIETIVSFGVFFSLLLASAIWLGAAFMMEMLRDLTRHLISQGNTNA